MAWQLISAWSSWVIINLLLKSKPKIFVHYKKRKRLKMTLNCFSFIRKTLWNVFECLKVSAFITRFGKNKKQTLLVWYHPWLHWLSLGIRISPFLSSNSLRTRSLGSSWPTLEAAKRACSQANQATVQQVRVTSKKIGIVKVVYLSYYILWLAAKTCPDPGRPENGDRFGYFKVGSTVRFSCQSGFEMHGSRERTCLESKEWTGSLTTCQDRSKLGVANFF